MQKSGINLIIVSIAAMTAACQQSDFRQNEDAGGTDGYVLTATDGSTRDAAAARSLGKQDTIEDEIGRPIRTDEIEERADASFSAYPLGEETLSSYSQGFTGPGDNCGSTDEGCAWRDPDGVLHYLDSENNLEAKAVVAKDFTKRKIAALGIGSARERSAVLANASEYLLGAKPECLEADKAGEGEGIASCYFEFSEIRIKLLFDSADNLIRADLYQVGGV